MTNFMLLATAWGPKHGGINAFNMDFAIGLANHLGESAKVFCAVFLPTAEDVADARGKRVNLVAINRPIESSAYDASWAHEVWKAFKQNYPNETIDWWVGHDVTTGCAAVEGPSAAEQGQSALIMHMNYVDYQNYKSGIGKAAQEKENQQRKLFRMAHRCFANGPLLRDALADIVGPDVTMLVPGFAAVPIQPSAHRLHLITFGRMDRESARIKQGALAVAGFASAVKQVNSTPGMPEILKNNPQMRVIGLKESAGKEENVLIRLAAERANREVNVIALPFDELRNELLDELGRANIALMLSWHEGFGLTGWEAVAAEVPLIISKQTGLWQLLKETFGERLAAGYVRAIDVRGQRGDDDTSNFLPEDEASVRDAIIDCAAHLPIARGDAVKLKHDLKNKLICTWDHTARQFYDGLRYTSARPSIPVSLDPRPLLKPTTVAAQKSDFVTIPKPDWPQDSGMDMPDSMLLLPQSRVVRFHHQRGSLRDAIIDWANKSDARIKLRLQAGEGGAGKTRLLIEVCDQLERFHGWRAGFVDSSKSSVSELPKLLGEGKSCLLVLDYAESRTKEIVEITRIALHSRNTPYLRLVLLAREGGDWWDRLADAALSDQAVAAILRGVTTKTGPYRMAEENIELNDRGTVFNQALEDFAAFKKLPIPVITLPSLSADLFRNPLFIHLSALASLRGHSNLNDKELLGITVGHERSYWHKLLSEADLTEQMVPPLEQSVALLTLAGGKRTAREAKALLERTPRLRELDSQIRTQLFDILRRIYPHPAEGGLLGLQPDLLGETLVAEALAKDDELLDAIFGEESDHGVIRHALTVLTRLGRRAVAEQRWLKLSLERYLVKLCEDAMHVGLETGSPMPEILAQVISAAEPRARRRVVDLLRVKLPNETLNLTTLNVEVRRQEIAFLQNKSSGNSAKRHIALVEEFHRLSEALVEGGNLAEAADAAAQAAQHADIVFRSESADHRSRLGVIISFFAGRLYHVGRYKEALRQAERAEAIRRELAKKASDASAADLAISIGNVGAGLAKVGRLEEALQKFEQAEVIQRRLAEKRPDEYVAGWTVSLLNISTELGQFGRFEEALQKAEEAEAVLGKLVQTEADKYTEDWTRALICLSHRLDAIGRFEEALQMADKAEAKLHGLAEKQPDRFTADWADSLHNLSRRLIAVGRFEEALKMAEKANFLWREQAEKQPEAHRPNWSDSLINLGFSLGAMGRFEEALQKSAQGEAVRRELAEKQPETYAAGWADSLSNVGVYLKEVGRFEDALNRAEQAENIRHKLAERQPDAYTPEWASSLANLADAQLSSGLPKLALETSKKAISIIRPLAENHPSLYKSWLGFAQHIVADSHFAMGNLEDSLIEAERSAQIWAEIAIVRQNFRSDRVAKAFLTLMRCEIANGRSERAVVTLRRTFDLLRKPLNDNPRPLKPVMSELLEMAMSVDPGSIATVPGELLATVRTSA